MTVRISPFVLGAAKQSSTPTDSGFESGIHEQLSTNNDFNGMPHYNYHNSIIDTNQLPLYK